MTFEELCEIIENVDIKLDFNELQELVLSLIEGCFDGIRKYSCESDPGSRFYSGYYHGELNAYGIILNLLGRLYADKK